MTRCFVYLRVSGAGQIDGDGKERQLLACQEYARAHELEIVEVFHEDGVSGTRELTDRPALGMLLAALEENGIKTILIEKIDRLARDLMVSETIIADMRKRGYTLISTAEPDLCSNEPSRVLIRQIFGAIAQWDKDMLVLKLNAARARMRARGERAEGVKPYGTKDGEQAILDHMASLRAAGFTLHDIAAALNDSGSVSRSGRPWHSSTIHKILARI